MQWYAELLTGAKTALARENSPPSWHGGMLALEALLSCCAAHASAEFVLSCFGAAPPLPRVRLRPRFPLPSDLPRRGAGVASEAAMRHVAQRKTPELHACALRLLPELARARPDEFISERLEESLRLLAEASRDTRSRTPGPPLRADAFATLAALLETLGGARLQPHTAGVVLPRLLPALREALPAWSSLPSW